MTLLQSDNITLHQTLHSFLNRKNLLIFVLGAIGLYVLYPSISRRKQVPHFNAINVKKNQIKTDQIITDQHLSPFHRTLGFIRWNSAHRERIAVMEKYRPFFADLHYSMPDYTSTLNFTADGWKSVETPYKAVAETMHIILQNYSTIEGVLYFHFDAWINPFKFDDLNFHNIWFPDANLPPFRCVQDIKGWEWWAWGRQYHDVAKNATVVVARNYSKRFVTDVNTFCGGWSDIYYIPRRFFNDFIDLTSIFYQAGSFHEVGIPTMLNIIDLTYRKTPLHSIITRLGDCWGDCCASGSQPADIKRKRCGHRMDLSNEVVRQTLIEILDSEAAHLNLSQTRKVETG